MKEEAVIRILGDVCPAWGFRDSFDRRRADLVFGTVLQDLQASDFVVANLESPLSDYDKAIEKCGPNLKGNRADMEVLKKAGINAVSLANNHILDYGAQAIRETLEAAAEADIRTFGGAMNERDAEKPLIISVKGHNLGLLSFAEEEFNTAKGELPGACLFDPYRSLHIIADTKSKCDVLIVLYHGGIEEYKYPSPLLQKKCRSIADAGADLILCQHSHCIGSRENYHGAEIIYGQGNSIFGRQEGNDDWNFGLIVKVVLSDGAPSLSYDVVEALHEGISYVDASRAGRILEEMEERSLSILAPGFLEKEWQRFCQNAAALYLPLLYGWGKIANKGNRVLKNRLAKIRLSRKKMRITMNLIRCDAHREVAQTILELMQNER